MVEVLAGYSDACFRIQCFHYPRYLLRYFVNVHHRPAFHSMNHFAHALQALCRDLSPTQPLAYTESLDS